MQQGDGNIKRPPAKRRRVQPRRVRARLAKYLAEHVNPHEEHLTVLERRAVTDEAVTQYGRELDGLCAYAKVPVVTRTPEAEVGETTAKYMERQFLRGVTPHRGMKLVAGLMHALPAFRKGGRSGLPRAWRARKLCPMRDP